jgi:hypothetical protein
MICSEDSFIERGSATPKLASSTFLFSLLCSGWGSKEEHPLVDSELESSSPVRIKMSWDVVKREKCNLKQTICLNYLFSGT